MSSSSSIVKEFWEHPWGRTLLIAATIAAVSWAVRETAVITWPVFQAISSVLVPLALGFTIAYVLTPAVDMLQRRGVKRVIGTSILFVLLLLVSLLIMSLVIPALVVQTTDIVKRSVEDSYFYDENADGRYSPGEALIRPFKEDGHTYYFHDANNNGRYDLGEGRYDESNFATITNSAGIVREPSFIQKITDLIDSYRVDIEAMAGIEPDERALTFLHYYLEQTRVVRQQIREGLTIGSDDQAWRDWIRSARPSQANGEHLIWQRSWPGAEWSELQSAEEAIPAEQRQEWIQAMAALGQRYVRQHQRLLDQWQKIRSGQGIEGGAGSQLLNKLQAGLSEEEREEALKFINELREQRHPAARKLLIAISGTGSSTSQGVVQEMVVSFNGVVQQQLSQMPEYAAGWAGQLLTNIDAVLMFGLNLVLIPIYAFFLCLAMPTIRATLKAYIPIKGHDRTLRIVQRIERAVAAFFRGRLIVCIICAFLTWIGFAILQIPYAALFGLLIGLATAIPLAGLVFLVPAILLTVIEGGDAVTLRVIMAIVVYGGVQTLEATLLTPTIMGKEVELHPVLLIVALLLCGSLLGILGLILAVPIAATVRIFAREFFLPHIREAAGVPDTMALQRKIEDNNILTRDIAQQQAAADEKRRKSVTDVDEEDLSDFETSPSSKQS